MPVVTSGITHALSIFGDMWVDAEDVIILPEMNWGNYHLIFNIRRGADFVTYRIFSDGGGFNIDSFKKAVYGQSVQKKKMIVLLNFPHNPSGYSPTEWEVEQIIDILADVSQNGTNVIAVCDDAYFGLFYEEETFKESIFSRLCGRDPRLLAIKLDGATKEDFAWGLRVGFITYGYKKDEDSQVLFEALEQKTAGCVRSSISNASHLSQSIILKSMQSKDYQKEKAEKFSILQKRARQVKKILANPKYQEAWEAYPFNSGYFLCLRLKTVDAETLRTYMLDKYGVGIISIGHQNIRVAFSCIDEELIEALFEIIFQGIDELQGLNK